MLGLRPIAVLLLALVGVAPAAAAERSCLNKDAQRAAVAAGQAVPLAKAMQAIRPRTKGDVVRAQLCQSPNGLVYVLTLLPHNGKVTNATVDAANGKLLGGG